MKSSSEALIINLVILSVTCQVKTLRKFTIKIHMIKHIRLNLKKLLYAILKNAPTGNHHGGWVIQISSLLLTGSKTKVKLITMATNKLTSNCSATFEPAFMCM
jgi:hypothetical protein